MNTCGGFLWHAEALKKHKPINQKTKTQTKVRMFWDDRGGGLTGQPMGPQVNTANIRTVLNINRVDSKKFSSRGWAFRRTHSSADPIQILCIRLALPLTLSLASRFAPSARLTVSGTPCALWLGGDFSCYSLFWEKKGGGLTRQPVGPPVGTATMTAVMSANRVDFESLSSRCWTFRRIHTSVDPIRVFCARLALPLTLSLPSRLAPSARLTFGVAPRALWLAEIFLRRKKICAGVVGTRTDWVSKGEEGGRTTSLLQHVARFEGVGEIVGFGGGDYKESWLWYSLFVGFPSLFVAPSGEQLALPMCLGGASLSAISRVFVPIFLFGRSVVVDVEGVRSGRELP